MKYITFVIYIFLVMFACAGCSGGGNSSEQKSSKTTDKKTVAVYFKNGDVMVGEMISQTEDQYVLNWKGKETVIYPEMVERIGNPKEALLEKEEPLTDEEITSHWPYINDVILRLTNQKVLDVEITSVAKDRLTVKHPLEGGGYITQEIDRSQLEYLIFKPVENEKTKDTEAFLKKLFAEMEFYRVGNFTIITDSYITWVKEYQKTVKDVSTNIYLKFLPLFKDRKQEFQNFIVIFDDYTDFVDYAVTDGVPGWAVAGYFTPEDKVLFLYNVLGDKMSEILFEALVGESGRTIDNIVDSVSKYGNDDNYKIYVKGQAKRIKDKFWQAYSFYKGMYKQITMNTLRHEFTHEFFHNWGLQTIVLSRAEKDKKHMEEMKKEFTEAKDAKQTAEFIKKIITYKSDPIDMKAANSCFVEGIATYCETDEPGDQNDRWLFIYQEMARQGAIYPLEVLTSYRMGSFPGVCSQAMQELYAQSWAFVTFLMDKYPEEFLGYQKKLSDQYAKGRDEANLLEKELGKDLKSIQKEFILYMNKFERLEEPFLVEFDKILDILRD
ncbi:MAG: hypothetical protein GY853_02665 [PVC group bacterium]|nr:hypothetical protein [PVC group bacterium]